MRMKTGEFLRVTGTTAKTLRYYEEKELLKPARDTGSAYRSYSEHDIVALWEIQTLHSLGFGLDQIDFSAVTDENNSVLQTLTQIQQQLDGEISKLERRLQTVISTKHRFEQLSASNDNIAEYSYQSILRLFVNDPSVSAYPCFADAVRDWACAIPSTKLTLVIDHTALTGKPEHLLPVRIGLGIAARNAQSLRLHAGKPVEVFPRCKGFMCHICVDNPLDIRERDLYPLISHCERLQLEISGDFHARLSYIERIEDTYRYHFFLHCVVT